MNKSIKNTELYLRVCVSCKPIRRAKTETSEHVELNVPYFVILESYSVSNLGSNLNGPNNVYFKMGFVLYACSFKCFVNQNSFEHTTKFLFCGVLKFLQIF